VPFLGTNLWRSNYEVTSDSRRFIVHTLLDKAGAAPITVVVNWAAAVGTR
jgi:hypothetical protein